jgi:two-component system, NtrC family, sensor kinase
MKSVKIKTIFFISFLSLTFVFGLLLAGVGYYLFSAGVFSSPGNNLAFLLGFVFIIAVLAGMGLAYWLTLLFHRPVREILKATQKFNQGDLDYRILKTTSIRELNLAVEQLNSMVEGLNTRESTSKVSAEELTVMNKRYLDLVGFVSHELKGILSSIILNTYNLRNEILGPVNQAQKKTLASISKNLDYLTNTVKNFLSLSRIEKGEMVLNKGSINFKSEVVEPSLEAFSQWIDEKKIRVANNIQEDLIINADLGLIQVVTNNLISNALKYGVENGSLVINKNISQGFAEIEIYNDGKVIEDIDVDKLFKKFSRLLYRGTERVKGTGIGLFISKEIVEAHGGKIWVEPKEKGNSFKFTVALI